MAFNLADVLRSLERMGLTDVALPFLLIFTIVFATLQKTNILGAGKKNFNIVIALILALTVVIPHVVPTPGIPDVVNIINKALPSVSLLAVAAIMLLLLIGLFGGESRWLGSSLSGWMAIIAFISIAYIFGGAAGWWATGAINAWWNPASWDSDTTALVIIILIFGIVVWYITKQDTSAEGAVKIGKVLEGVGNFFGGKKD